MAKNVTIGILVLALLGLAAYFVAPRFGFTLIKAPFDAQAITGEIMLEVGESNVSRGLLCNGINQAFGAGLNSTCQQNRYSATESKKKIEQIMSRYAAKPIGEWDISEAGYGRSYRSNDMSNYESVLILVSNDIVFVSH